KANRPWEGWRIALYGSVLFDEDEKVFKMWYWGGDASDCFPKNAAAMYATSQDGIAWEKPLLGTLPCPKVSKHNAVAACMQASVIKDNNDADPARRYKMICWLRD